MSISCIASHVRDSPVSVAGESRRKVALEIRACTAPNVEIAVSMIFSPFAGVSEVTTALPTSKLIFLTGAVLVFIA